jgi:hypothetical protein
MSLSVLPCLINCDHAIYSLISALNHDSIHQEHQHGFFIVVRVHHEMGATHPQDLVGGLALSRDIL